MTAILCVMTVVHDPCAQLQVFTQTGFIALAIVAACKARELSIDQRHVSAGHHIFVHDLCVYPDG